jgi:protein gp37
MVQQGQVFQLTRRGPEWIRDLRDRCHAQGIAFFFKQWGGRTPKAGGRLLDGVEWSEMPTGQTTVGVQTDLPANAPVFDALERAF